jgi:hypothetical protein
MTNRSSHEMFNRLLAAPGQTRAAKTIEVFGWICLLEAVVVTFSPFFVASVLHLPTLTEQGANYFRLAALLVGGVGMLYVVSGRLNSAEFAFASLLDRPLVPPTMAVLWYLGIVPGPLALAFSIQDFSGFLWTLHAWRAQDAAIAVAH